MISTTNFQSVCLSDLVGELEFFRAETWSVMSAQYESVDMKGLLSSAAIKDQLDCGLLVRPFVRLFPDVPSAWVTRVVVNNDLHGYLDPDRIDDLLEGPSALVLEQIELWNDDVAGLTSQLQTDVSFRVRATAVLLPNTTGSLPLRDLLGAAAEDHLFIVPTEGAISLNAGTKVGSTSHPYASAPVIGTQNTYYLPPGELVSVAAADETPSTFIVFRMKEPSAEELAELVLALFLAGPAEKISGLHHTMTMSEKVSWMRDRLPEYLETLPARSLLELASSEAAG